MKRIIDALHLRLSDLFLALGLIPATVLFVSAIQYMGIGSEAGSPLPLAVIIILFILAVGFWATYVVLEKECLKNKFAIIALYVFLLLTIINLITILTQPASINHTITNFHPHAWTYGEVITINTDVSWFTKIYFIFDLIIMMLFFFIGLFIFPHRLSSERFFEYFGYFLFTIIAVAVTYSLIADFNSYIGFFKQLFSPEEGKALEDFSPKSFLGHRNTFGMLLMAGIITCLISQAATKKNFYYYIAGGLFINLIFTLCKAGIIFTLISVLFYVYMRLALYYKVDKKKSLTAIIAISGAIALGLIIFGIVCLASVKVRESIGRIFAEGETIQARVSIWNNAIVLLNDGYWLTGRGVGVFNVALMDLNTGLQNDPTFSCHSWLFSLLGRGGIVYVLGYLSLVGYAVYIMKKDFKEEPLIATSIATGLLMFFMHSFLEDNYFLVMFYIYELLLLDSCIVQKRG